MKTSVIFTFSDLRSQSIELLCRSLGYGSGGLQLSLANGMHYFNARNRTVRRPKGLESPHRSHSLFHTTVILFCDVIEIFRMADDDRGVVVTVVVLNCLVLKLRSLAKVLQEREIFGDALQK